MQTLRSNWSRVRRLVGWFLAFAILVFLVQALLSSWDQVVASGFEFHFDWGLLLLSLLLLVVGRGFAVEAWRRILAALGDRLPYRVAFRAWFLSNLARYVPGNVWQLATMMALVERQGVSKTNVLLSQSLYAVVALSIAGLLGLLLLPLPPGWLPLIGLLLVGLILLLAQPRVFNGLLDLAEFGLRTLARWFPRGRPSAPAERALPFKPTRPPYTFLMGLVPPLCSSTMWLTNGLAFFLFIRSVTNVSLDRLPVLAAVNAAAYFVGYVSFLTPSGLGFREGAMVLLLAPFFPTPVAVALAFAARIWSTVGEFLGVGLALWPIQPAPQLAPQSAPQPLLDPDPRR